MKVRQIMGQPKVVSPDTSVKDAAKIMAEFDISTLFVVTGHKVEGMVTDMDIIRRFATSDSRPKDMHVKEIMTSHLITVNANENVEEAVYVMQKNGIRRLPVVEKGKFVGIITTDYISAHASELGVDALFD